MKNILFAMVAFCALNSVVSANTNYSNAMRAGDFLYVSAQFPIDPVTGKMLDGEMVDLTNVTLDHIQHLLHKKGFKMLDVVKTEVYLTDIRDFDAMDAAYSERFNFQFPPTRDVIVSPQLLNNARIQISCIAYKP